MAEEKNALYERLPKLLQMLIDSISSENEEYIKNKILCKFLITETSTLEIVFLYCPAKSKISLIHNIMYTSSIVNNIKQLIYMMTRDEKNELIGLLIVELQKDATPKSIRRRLSSSAGFKSVITDKHDTTLHTQLYLMTKLWSDAEGEILEDLIMVLILFLSNMAK